MQKRPDHLIIQKDIAPRRVDILACVETSGCVVRSSGDHLTTTIGIKNCIIVHTLQATLVADKSDENSIKELIELLKKQGLQNYL